MGRWLCLGLAVNFRPNMAVFVLVELACASNIRDVLLHAVYPGLISIAISVCSYILANKVYPSYSIPVILHNLNIYNTLYLVQDMGDSFNSSLYGLLKNARHFLKMQPYYSPVVTLAVTSGGAVILVVTIALAFLRTALPRG